VISTASTAPKVTALSARPDVALTIDAGDTPDQARSLSIRGRVSVEIVDGVPEEYLASVRKTMDAEAAAQFEQNCRELYDRIARIAITPHWLHYYGTRPPVTATARQQYYQLYSKYVQGDDLAAR
jgi:hypothetical protein